MLDLKLKKYSRNEMLLVLISFFSFFTITQNLYPISINRVLILFMSIVLCVKKTYDKKSICIFLIIVILFIYSCIVSTDFIRNINDFAYYFFAILMLLEFYDNKEKMGLQESYSNISHFVDKITIVNFIVILIEALTPTCYYSEWGGRYFCGLTDAGHTIAPGICLNMALMLLYLDKKEFKAKNLIILCTYLVILFNTGARIFIVPSVILIYYYFSNKIIQKKNKIIYSILAVIIFVFIFLKTGMYDKFVYAITGSSGNKMSFFQFFTSSRSVFWIADLKDYIHSSILEKFFGHGFDYIYQLNSRDVGMTIWAHNDFINLLVGVGLTGFLIYIYALKRLFFNIKRLLSKKNFALAVCYVFIPAFFNGFYTYVHYILSFFVFLILIIKNDESKKIV